MSVNDYFRTELESKCDAEDENSEEKFRKKKQNISEFKEYFESMETRSKLSKEMSFYSVDPTTDSYFIQVNMFYYFVKSDN